MNYMESTAKTLGVELGERFKLKTKGGEDNREFYFAESGLYVRGNCYECGANDFIPSILNGFYQIVKESRPWLPKRGDFYYLITNFEPKRYPDSPFYAENDISNHTIREVEWFDDVADYVYYATGNCFKTQEEAEAAIPWVKENIKRLKRGEKWEMRE